MIEYRDSFRETLLDARRRLRRNLSGYEQDG
jgi:hypothetical protein